LAAKTEQNNLFSIACCWAGEEIILFCFGSQWAKSVPLFQLLALSVWPQMITTSVSSIYRSTGNTKLMFRSSLIHASMMAILIGFGVSTHDLEKTALMVTISLYARFLLDFYFLVVKNFGYSYGTFLRSFSGELLIAVVMIAGVAVCHPLITVKGFVGLCAKMTVMVGTFFTGLAITGQYRIIAAFFKRK